MKYQFLKESVLQDMMLDDDEIESLTPKNQSYGSHNKEDGWYDDPDYGIKNMEMFLMKEVAPCLTETYDMKRNRQLVGPWMRALKELSMKCGTLEEFNRKFWEELNFSNRRECQLPPLDITSDYDFQQDAHESLSDYYMATHNPRRLTARIREPKAWSRLNNGEETPSDTDSITEA